MARSPSGDRNFDPVLRIEDAEVDLSTDIVADASGRLWMGTGRGALSFDPSVGPSSLVKHDATNSTLPGGWTEDVELAPDGTLWFAVRSTVWGGGGIARYAPATDSWSGWPAVGEHLSAQHQEWIVIERDARKLRCFVVYPEVKEKVQAVLLIHENKGLTDWVREVADRLAEAGYLALAPDLLSGAGPGAGDTSSFESTDAATKALYALDPVQVMADLDAACERARNLAACNGKVSVAGFCWGGAQSFEFATHAKELVAAYVFYGSPPKDEAALAGITCPEIGRAHV